MPVLASWLADDDNYRWLDFGAGQQLISDVALRVMLTRPLHCIRLFNPPGVQSPVGVVALSDIDPRFHKATLWYVLGDKRFAGRGLTRRAVSQLLDFAFRSLSLHCVFAWAAEPNLASVQILTKNGFQLAGRQRQCHVLDGRRCDRLLFDLLATEYEHALAPR